MPSSIDKELEDKVLLLEKELKDEIGCEIEDSEDQSIDVKTLKKTKILKKQDVKDMNRKQLIDDLMKLQELIPDFEPFTKTHYRNLKVDDLKKLLCEMKKMPTEVADKVESVEDEPAEEEPAEEEPKKDLVEDSDEDSDTETFGSYYSIDSDDKKKCSETKTVKIKVEKQKNRCVTINIYL